MGRPPHELPSEYAERTLRAKLAGMASGDQLPTNRQLADELSVSREVVSRTVAKLKGEGLVFTRGRWGVFKT